MLLANNLKVPYDSKWKSKNVAFTLEVVFGASDPKDGTLERSLIQVKVWLLFSSL